MNVGRYAGRNVQLWIAGIQETEEGVSADSTAIQKGEEKRYVLTSIAGAGVIDLRDICNVKHI